MLVWAYAEDGRRALHELREGDYVEWKEQGRRGFRKAFVSALVPEAKRPIRLTPIIAIDPNSARPADARSRWVGPFAIMYVFNRDGTRRKPA